MLLIAADYHPSFQQIAFFAEETSERGERQLKSNWSTEDNVCEFSVSIGTQLSPERKRGPFS
jgi:hypothetical protein